MVESYKNKSKIANILVFTAGLITYIGVDNLTKIMPAEYAYLAPIIVMVAGYIIVQNTEDRRVNVAEQLITEKYSTHVSDDDGIQ